VQFGGDALAPPGRAYQQVEYRERAPRALGGDRRRQRCGQPLPPVGRGAKRQAGRVADQVAAVARLGEHESGLAALHPEPGRVISGVPVISGVAVHLGIQGFDVTGAGL
jgi:hypothetical protein